MIVLRAASDGEATRIAELLNDGATEIGDPPSITADLIRFDWRSVGFDRQRQTRVATVDGRIIGTATTWFLGSRAHIEGYVERASRGRGAGGLLVRWGLETGMAGPGIRQVTMTIPEERRDARALVQSIDGFRHVRSFFMMLHRAPGAAGAPVWPEGIHLAPLRDEELARAAAAAHAGSFADHWGYRPMHVEDYLHWIRNDPDDDPDLWLIGMHDRAIAGFLASHTEGRGPMRRGYVDQIGTVERFRGIGLGRALLREALSRMAQRGITEVQLDVDAENATGALRLYRATGFEVVRELPVYGFDVAEEPTSSAPAAG